MYILELNAAEGGEDAKLLAGDMAKAYEKYMMRVG